MTTYNININLYDNDGSLISDSYVRNFDNLEDAQRYYNEAVQDSTYGLTEVPNNANYASIELQEWSIDDENSDDADYNVLTDETKQLF